MTKPGRSRAPARPRSERDCADQRSFEHPHPPRHKGGHEHDRNDERDLDRVDHAVGGEGEGRRRAPASPGDADPYERGHRRELKQEYDAEQPELGPEEPIVPVEIWALAAVKDARESRHDPENGGGTPG